MRLQFVFAPGNIRVRVEQASLFSETIDLAHASRPGHDLLRDVWMKRIVGDLGEGGDEVLRVMRSALVQVQCLGIETATIANCDESFAATVDAALSVPRQRWTAMLAQIGFDRSNIDARVMNGKGDGLSDLSTHLQLFYDASVGRRHLHLRNVLHEAWVDHIERLGRLGVDAYLSQLHQSFDWNPPVLTYRAFNDSCHPLCPHKDAVIHTEPWSAQSFKVGDDGLVVALSVMTDVPAVSVLDDVVIVTIPAAVDQRLKTFLQTPAVADEDLDSLGSLIGRSRAWALQSLCSKSYSTSQLASHVGISIASASEHATALRHAGLISSRRDRNAMVHAATPLGLSLVQASIANPSANT